MRRLRLSFVALACIILSGCAMRGVGWGPPPYAAYEEGAIGHTMICYGLGGRGPLALGWCTNGLPTTWRRTDVPARLRLWGW